MPRRKALESLGFLDILVDTDGEPPCDPPDDCPVCRLFTLPLQEIGALLRAAPARLGRPRKGG